MSKFYKTWVEISKVSVKHNVGVFRKLLGPKTKLMSVVKSNAYGHGLWDFSKLAAEFGVDWFGADSLSEALKLREKGIEKPILVLGYTRRERLVEVAQNDISLTLYDIDNLKSWAKNFARSSGRPLKIHLKIDTGMNRQGIYPEELADFLRQAKKIPNLAIEGVYTHFASAKDITYPFYTNQQLVKFKKACAILEDFGYRNVLKHAAATSGTLLYPDSRLDLVRVGIGLYGLWPSKEAQSQHAEIIGYKVELKPVLNWKTVVAQVKNIKKGDFIGYDLTEKMTKDAKIAVLPIGYWHGYDRGFSGIGEVLVNGTRCRVLGRVSMDMIVVDASRAGRIKVEDEAVLLGQQALRLRSGQAIEEIRAEELAQKIGTIPYEVITRINPQTPRIVI